MRTSVVMASYNGKEFIIEQLDSLRKQSVIIDEVIICDDGSSDGTDIIIQEYISENHLGDTWKFIKNESNLGYANNFYKAMMLAHGDYIFFCDQDDVWFENKVKETVQIMEDRPEIQLLCTEFEPLFSTNDAPSVQKEITCRMRNDQTLEKLELNKKNIHIASIGCVMTIRKTFRDRISPYWVNGWAHDDFVWKLSQCLDGCYLYHKEMIYRRLHSNNVSMKKKHNKSVRCRFLRDLAISTEATLKFAVENDVSESQVLFLKRLSKASKMRAELVDNKKMINFIKLLFYADCYQSKKSILVELLIACKKGNVR